MNRREALRTLAAGSAAGALAGGIAMMATPSAAEASADPFVQRMATYREDIRAYDADCDAWDESGKAFPWVVLHEELDRGCLAIGSPAGAVVALEELLSLDCITDGAGLAMVEAVLGYLKAEGV